MLQPGPFHARTNPDLHRLAQIAVSCNLTVRSKATHIYYAFKVAVGDASSRLICILPFTRHSNGVRTMSSFTILWNN